MYKGKVSRRNLWFRLSTKRLFFFALPFILMLVSDQLIADQPACRDCHTGIKLSQSVHAGLSCKNCHEKIKFINEDKIHGQIKERFSCKSCHDGIVAKFNKGEHASRLTFKKGMTCATCHGSHAIQPALASQSKLYQYITSHLAQSVHKGFECSSCHIMQKNNPKKVNPAKLRTGLKCGSCHTGVVAEYKKSVHGKKVGSDKDVAYCSDCHGSHVILSSKDPKSPVNKFKLHITCAKCHSQKPMMEKHHVKKGDAVVQFVDSMHGQALIKRGLKVAPSCNDCHGVHNIQNSQHPQSPISHENLPDTCGKCHLGVEEVYNASVHGQELKKGNKKAPVCSTCHVAHASVHTNDKEFKIASDKTCGHCHQDRLKRYRETYHGKALVLGEGDVAACYDCHGTHNIYPTDNPKSLLFRGKTENGEFVDNRLKTCQQCHPQATFKFAGYYAHADHSDKEQYPVLYWVYIFMTALLLGTFAFFGLHTLLWLTRSLYFYYKNPEGFKQAKIKIKQDDEIFIRFNPVDRFLHGLIIISFLLLVITGMPIKFYYTDWAKVIFDMLGGSEAARSLHRLGAIITIFYFLVHIITVMNRLKKSWFKTRDSETGKLSIKSLIKILTGPDSPVPNKQDAIDFWNHQKYFFGKGPQPQFDRWTYWEKFDYWAVFWGVAVIGISGLIMWMPVTFTKVLPGWVINVALVIHSDEALLAAGFIFTFHFFNVHFRPEKFPIDSVIFSGRISKAEMEHERGRLLERLQKEKRIDQERLKDEWEGWKKVMHPFGYLAFGIGVALIILIYMAMGARLLQ